VSTGTVMAYTLTGGVCCESLLGNELLLQMISAMRICCCRTFMK